MKKTILSSFRKAHFRTARFHHLRSNTVGFEQKLTLPIPFLPDRISSINTTDDFLREPHHEMGIAMWRSEALLT
jgi:hypothetical protein